MFNNESDGAMGADVRSAYEQVFGEHFAALDPQLRSYFGPIPPGFEGLGSGRFRQAGLRRRLLRPVFAILGRRGIAFADLGSDVPFTIRNVETPQGARQSIRRFEFPRGTRGHGR